MLSFLPPEITAAGRSILPRRVTLYHCPTMRLSPWIQQPLDALRLAGNDLQVGLGWPVRLRAALLPVPESAEGDVVADGEFLLRQRQSAANDFCLRRSL